MRNLFAATIVDNYATRAGRMVLHALTLTLVSLMLAACGSGGFNENGTEAAATRLSIGKALFNEVTLSASGQQACATCHADETAHADPLGTTLPVGGLTMDQEGFRSSPSLRYLAANAAFQRVRDLAFGGFTWDGRADSLADQPAIPLLDKSEMANENLGAVVARMRKLSYFEDFRRVYDLPSNATDQQIFDALKLALATYQLEDPSFRLFNSKFDRFLDGMVTLTAEESRGLAIFNDATRGNCASCHPSQVGPDGSKPIFTNFSYAALGLPRNPIIKANANPNFYDMGLCGPKRTDLANRQGFCGQFKVPTLRNIAVTAPYFHNASVATLEQAVSFYATRDIDPARWYPVVEGRPDVFNDLPLRLRGNVIPSAPFGLAPGSAPLLSTQDVSDLVAFLRTLTDDNPANR